MRLWSIHPKYLDAKGMVALWRETLLAKKVLEGNTKGYKNHPQLNRFKQSEDSLHAINKYLEIVFEEATKKGYHFDASKFKISSSKIELKVTEGQLQYEFQHLLKKLAVRDIKKFQELSALKNIEAHTIFTIIEGDIEDWEIV